MTNAGWRRLRPVALSGLAGVAVFVSFPAWDVFPLAFVALAPLMAACTGVSPRRAFGLGWLMGLVTNVGGFYWIAPMAHVHGYLPWVVSVGLLLLLAAEQGVAWALSAGGAVWLERRRVPAALAWAAAVCASESVVPMIFPWRFGHAQHAFPAVAQLAELGGVGLVTALVVVVNSAVLDGARRRRWTQTASVACGLLAVTVAFGAARIARLDAQMSAARSLRVGMVQANIGVGDKGEGAALIANFDAHRRLSSRLASDGAELIVWPETAYEAPGYFHTTEVTTELGTAILRSATRRLLSRDVTWIPPGSSGADGSGRSPNADLAPQLDHRVPMLVGAVMVRPLTAEQQEEAPPRGGARRSFSVHNAALLLDGSGRVAGTYDKTLLMPFTEQVPLGRLVWRLTGLNLYDVVPAAGDFAQGAPTDGLVLVRPDGDVRIGIMICYEDIMPEFGRAIHAGRPQVLVNITNDAWFLDTAEPALHLALSTFRTIEQRVALVRSTNTGISAFVDPVGRVVSRTPTYEAATLAWDVPLLDARTTPFMRFGDWPGWLLSAAAVIVAVRRRRTPAR